MPNWRESVCQIVGMERIGDISKYISRENPSEKSPIDDFYLTSQSLMTSITPDLINSSDWIGSTYAISIVSNTENYFRDIFSQILKMCPDTQKNAAGQNINFGSVIWHPNDIVERGAFEHISLACSDNIINTTKKYIGIDLKCTHLKPILEEFEKVCELRHGIVHSNRVLAGKNAIKLKLPSSDKITKIVISFGQLQEITSICTTLVISFNQLMFEEMAKRWATTWRNSPIWDNKLENSFFKALWKTFYSEQDQKNGTIPYSGTWVKCRNDVKKEYNIE